MFEIAVRNDGYLQRWTEGRTKPPMAGLSAKGWLTCRNTRYRKCLPPAATCNGGGRGEGAAAPLHCPPRAKEQTYCWPSRQSTQSLPLPLFPCPCSLNLKQSSLVVAVAVADQPAMLSWSRKHVLGYWPPTAGSWLLAANSWLLAANGWLLPYMFRLHVLFLAARR